MKRNVVFSTLLSTALAVSLNAQSGSGSAASTPQDPAASTQSQVTVTGCLQNADMVGTTGTSGSGSATGTASSASDAASAVGQYILAKAKIGGGAASMSGGAASGTSGSATGSATPATGSAASGTASGMGDKFVLIGGSQNDKLKEYVNSQVEITGRILPKGSAAGGAMSGAGTGSSTGSSASGTASSASGTGSSASSMSGMSDPQRLQVTSVKQISSTCASGQ